MALAFEALVRFSSNSGAKRMSFLFFFLEARDEEKDGAAEISQYSYQVYILPVYIPVYIYV